MMFHNVDFVAGCSPNADSEERVLAALDDMRAAFRGIVASGGRFATLAGIDDSITRT